MSKLLLKIVAVLALLAFTLTQDCCMVPPDVGDLTSCNNYFGAIGCPNAVCGSCMGTNEIFSADPSCTYPC
jgi:hypothetical protein